MGGAKPVEAKPRNLWAGPEIQKAGPCEPSLVPHTLTGCPFLVRRRLSSSVSMPKATKGPVAMSPQYPRAATRSPH